MWKLALVILFIIFILCVLESIREQNTFEVTRYRIQSEKLKGKMKILFFSDLHNKSYGPDNNRLLAAAAKEKPDLILIGGDMLVGRRKDCFDEAVKLVRAVSRLAPVYYALGNHEQRMKEDLTIYGDMYQRYIRHYDGYGIRFLDNRSQKIRIKGQDLVVTGLTINYACYTKGFAWREFTEGEMKQCIAGNHDSEYHILMAHNPAYMRTYKKSGAEMILSGHMHGGIIRLPGLGGLISPQMRWFPRYEGGYYPEAGQDIIVSRGLGGHTMNMRFLNTPEMIVLELGGK